MQNTNLKFIAIILMVILCGCRNFQNKSKRIVNNAAFLKYKLFTDTIYSGPYTTISFTKTGRSFVVLFPFERDTNSALSISKGKKNKKYVEFLITSVNVPLAQYRFLISEIVEQPVIVKYTFDSRSPRVCYKVVHNDTLDLRENIFFDSCFQVEQLEKPFENFNVVYAEKENIANIIKLVNTTVGFENEIIVKFPNKILSYIPESIFGIKYIAKNNIDTNIAYFSIRNDSKCYIDSVCDIRFKKTKIINTLLLKKCTNFLIE